MVAGLRRICNERAAPHITFIPRPRWRCYHTGYSLSTFPGSRFLEDHRLANDDGHDVSEELVEITEEIPGHDMIDLEQCYLRWSGSA